MSVVRRPSSSSFVVVVCQQFQQSSSLKPLARFEWYLTGIVLRWPSCKFLKFMMISKKNMAARERGKLPYMSFANLSYMYAQGELLWSLECLSSVVRRSSFVVCQQFQQSSSLKPLARFHWYLMDIVFIISCKFLKFMVISQKTWLPGGGANFLICLYRKL